MRAGLWVTQQTDAHMLKGRRGEGNYADSTCLYAAGTYLTPPVLERWVLELPPFYIGKNKTKFSSLTAI